MTAQVTWPYPCPQPHEHDLVRVPSRIADSYLPILRGGKAQNGRMALKSGGIGGTLNTSIRPPMAVASTHAQGSPKLGRNTGIGLPIGAQHRSCSGPHGDKKFCKGPSSNSLFKPALPERTIGSRWICA